MPYYFCVINLIERCLYYRHDHRHVILTFSFYVTICCYAVSLIGKTLRKRAVSQHAHLTSYVSYVSDLKELKYVLYKPWRRKGFIQFESIINVLVSSF